MSRKAMFTVKVEACFLMTVLGSLAYCAEGAELNVTKTNWVERWITNVIEVRMPANRFVNEYCTNWVTQLRTNTVAVFVTNRVDRLLTNKVVVNAFLTNFVEARSTNWRVMTLTNKVAVEAIQTNLVQAYRTNLKTLNLTNWETVLVMKTNWIKQPVTNIAQIDLPMEHSAATRATASVEPVTQNGARLEVSSPPAVKPAEPWIIEAARTSRPVAGNQAEVQLKAKWASVTAGPLQVLRWRVESVDGAVLCFGEGQEFKRDLPLGKYKVEVRIRATGDGPPLIAREVLTVAAREALIQPKPAGRS